MHDPAPPAAATTASGHAPEASGATEPARTKRRTRLALAAAGAVATLLGLSLFGLVPSTRPRSPERVKLDVAQTVERARLPERAASLPPAHRLSLWSFPLCARPAEGARLFRLPLGPKRDSFAVWCQGEFVLVDVDSQAETPSVVRLGRFPARGELPGGATALDLDGDGVLDLALGVAPSAGVVHRAFSGVYWLRGRPEGGFQQARSLVEMPTVSLAAAELDEKPGAELVVLTRGDAAAQRPGELWIFAGGASPTRAAVVPAALAPSDLRVGPTRPEQRDVWVVSTQPGALLRLRFLHEPTGWPSAARLEIPLRGAQMFVRAPGDGQALYVRDALHVQTLVDSEGAPKLMPWHSDARVGPAALLGVESEREPTLLAASQDGFALFRGKARRFRSLPSGVQALDASSLESALPRPRGVLLASTSDQPAKLSLLIFPSDLRDEASEVELKAGVVEPAVGELRVALE
jgi:hypothetical protein